MTLKSLGAKIFEGVEVELDDEEDTEGMCRRGPLTYVALHQRSQNADIESPEAEEDEIPSLIRLEDCEPGSFIPLQIPRELPREYYKSSDPDWQGFLTLSRDHQRSKAVRRKFNDQTSEKARSAPELSLTLGLSLQKNWQTV